MRRFNILISKSIAFFGFIFFANISLCVSSNPVVQLNESARQLIEQGEYYQALDSLEKAHPMDKNHFDTYYNMGLAYQKLFHYEKALEKYSIVLRGQPDRFDLRWNLATIYNEIGQYDKSAEQLRYFISMNPPEDKLKTAESLLDSVEYRDSSKSEIIVMDTEDVIKHNEPDLIYYAFRGGIFYSDTSDTVLLFARGEDIEKNILVAACYNGKRKLRATLSKKALVEYWLRGSRSHSLLGYYVQPDGDFYLRIQIEETRRINHPSSGELIQRFTYKFYDVEIDEQSACWTLIEEGKRQEPECFLYRNRKN